MLRSFLWLCTLALLALLGDSAPVVAQENLSARPPAVSRNFAMLLLNIDSAATAQVSLSWMSAKPMPDVGEVQQALQDCLDGNTEILSATGAPGRLVQVQNRGAFQRHGLVVRGGMELASLMKLLRQRGITQLVLHIYHPHTGFSASEPQETAPSVMGAFRREERMRLRSMRASGVAVSPGFFPDMRRYEFSVQESPPRFVLEFGYGRESLLPLASLLILLVLPPAGTLLMRRRALRASVQDAAAAFFSFDRSVGWLCVLALLGWIVAVSVFHVDERLLEVSQFLRGRSYLGPVIPNPFAVWPIGLILVPNTCVWLGCLALSYPVYQRLRGVEWSRRQMIVQAFWRQASIILPLLFFCCALGAWLARDFRVVVLWGIAAYVSRVLGVRLRTSSTGVRAVPLDVGPLRDRIFELAKKAGVAIRQVYLLPSSKDRHANAAAVVGNKVVLFDYLVRSLSRREVDAIVAHELAHLRFRHPGKAGWFSKLVIFVFVVLLILIDIAPMWFSGFIARRPWLADALDFARDSRVFVWIVFLALASVVLRIGQRRWEFLADREAAALTGDHGAVITALVKLAHLNLQPMEWGKWQGRLLTHPSHSRRLQSLAEHGGLSREHLEELVKLPDDGSGTYEVPLPGAAEERIFSPGYRQRRAFVNTWLLLLTATVPPALVATAVQELDWHGPMRLLVLAGGFLVTCLAFAWVNGRLSVRGEPGLCRSLRERQQKEQLRPDDLGALCVAFSPASTIKLYEQSYDWDIGCLYLTSGLLCYVGEQTRFALRPEQIIDIRLRTGPPRWTRSRRIYLTWRDGEQAREGIFNLRPLGVRSLFHLEREVLRLHGRLRAWLAEPAQFPAPSKPLLQLTTPQLGEVTSTALHEASLTKTLLKILMLVSIIAVGVSLLFSPFPDRRGFFHLLYVVGCSTLTWLILFLPTWWRGLRRRTSATQEPR